GETPRYLFVRHPGDAAAVVQIARRGERRVAGSQDIAYLDAATGALLHQRIAPQPVLSVQRFVAGLHLIQFRHWTLRWIYFGLGLAGCVVIATGYLFWRESRKKKDERSSPRGMRLVAGLTVGSVGGIIAA